MSTELVPFQTLYLEPSKNGLTRPKSVRGSGYKMVNMGEIFAYDRINNPKMELVEMNDKELGSFSLKRGDLLFARQSLVVEGAGKCSIVLEVPETTTFESHLIRVRLDPTKVDSKFYYYYFQSYVGKGKIRSLVNQVAAAGIRGSELAKLPIHYLPLEQQRKIADILSAYDDLIENNTRRVELLEGMARALYREWFVEFRFPGHGTLEGGVPKGWCIAKLGERVELAYGKALKADTRVPGPYPVYGSSGVVGTHTERLVNGPGIIVGRKGNVGSVFWSDESFYPIDTVYYVQSALSLYYLYFNFQQQHFINNDAAVPGLSRNQAYSLPLVVPDPTTLERFDGFCGPIFKQLRTLRLRNTNLRSTRDLLLPKLISGALDVFALEGISTQTLEAVSV